MDLSDHYHDWYIVHSFQLFEAKDLGAKFVYSLHNKECDHDYLIAILQHFVEHIFFPIQRWL